jgi:hypothetical protein
MGRPYKNVDGRVAKALELIAGGLSERKACKEARVCRTTFHVRTNKYNKNNMTCGGVSDALMPDNAEADTEADTVPNTQPPTSPASLVQD